MGVMRFVVDEDRIASVKPEEAFVTGLDRIPWPCTLEYESGQLVVRRQVGHSGTFQLPWHVEGRGLLNLATATLRERSEPYHLATELARGKIAQVRGQLADWKQHGLRPDRGVAYKLEQAFHHFTHAVFSRRQPALATREAEQGLLLALDAGDHLVRDYVEQAVAARFREPDVVPFWSGAHLDTWCFEDEADATFLDAFDAVTIPVPWRDIEPLEGERQWPVSDQQFAWARRHQRTIVAGPLLVFEPHALPSWLDAGASDQGRLVTAIGRHVHSVVSRYRGRVDYWIAASRANTGTIGDLTAEQRATLSAQVAQWVHELDPETPLLMSVDQPWGEYLTRRRAAYPAFHFADALMRADLGIEALVLEMNIARHPSATLPRDMMELSRKLDFWSMLGTPLVVALTVPSSSRPDAHARKGITSIPGRWTSALQRSWAMHTVSMLMSKPYVRGYYWNQLSDALPHDHAHGGLFDDQFQAKPVVEGLARLRRRSIPEAVR